MKKGGAISSRLTRSFEWFFEVHPPTYLGSGPYRAGVDNPERSKIVHNLSAGHNPAFPAKSRLPGNEWRAAVAAAGRLRVGARKLRPTFLPSDGPTTFAEEIRTIILLGKMTRRVDDGYKYQELEHTIATK